MEDIEIVAFIFRIFGGNYYLVGVVLMQDKGIALHLGE